MYIMMQKTDSKDYKKMISAKIALSELGETGGGGGG